MPELTGQLAVVTGASSGLGEATAVRLAELGARAEDRDQPRRAAPEEALPAEDVAGYIAWLLCAPAHLMVTESVVAPIRERGWP